MRGKKINLIKTILHSSGGNRWKTGYKYGHLQMAMDAQPSPAAQPELLRPCVRAHAQQQLHIPCLQRPCLSQAARRRIIISI